jgi:hypothetical protein
MIHMIVILVIIGFLLWLATTYIPMNDTIKKILIFVVIAGTVLWLLNGFGLLDVPTFHFRN